MTINKIQEFYIYLFQINHLGVYSKFAPQKMSLLKNISFRISKIEASKQSTDQNSQPLEIDDKINLALIIR